MNDTLLTQTLLRPNPRTKQKIVEDKLADFFFLFLSFNSYKVLWFEDKAEMFIFHDKKFLVVALLPLVVF